MKQSSMKAGNIFGVQSLMRAFQDGVGGGGGGGGEGGGCVFPCSL